MKIITWNLADIWHITFSSHPPDILLCEGTGIGYKSIVKLKFCAKPMHQIYVINIVSFLKLVYQNKNELLGTSMAWQVWKKSLPTEILSSFALTAQHHQNIGNRSD